MRMTMLALCLLPGAAAAQSFCGKPPLISDGAAVTAGAKLVRETLQGGVDLADLPARAPLLVETLGAAYPATPQDEIAGLFAYNVCAALETSPIPRDVLVGIIRDTSHALGVEPPFAENTVLPRDAMGRPAPR